MNATYSIRALPERMLALGFAAVTVLLVPGCNSFSGTDACDGQVQQVLPGPAGGEVQVIETTCHGTDEMQIFVKATRSGTRSLVFSYDRMNPDPAFARKDVGPSVSWAGPDVVRITIDMVAYVRTQRSEVGRFKIEYRIGRILYPEGKHS